SIPSIAEEDENNDNEQYDYDRLQFPVDKRLDTSLLKNQHEQLPQITSTTTTGLSSWRIPRLLLNFISVSPHMLAQAEERLYQDLKNKYYGEYIHIR
ncbi:unnamed protein product, partial [Adineta steineri]